MDSPCPRSKTPPRAPSSPLSPSPQPAHWPPAVSPCCAAAPAEGYIPHGACQAPVNGISATIAALAPPGDCPNGYNEPNEPKSGGRNSPKMPMPGELRGGNSPFPKKNPYKC